MSETPTRKVVLLGDAGVGKTSLLEYFSTKQHRETEPSVSVGCTQFPYNGVTVNLWDTAGQETFRSMTTMYIRSSFGAILVFDLTNQQSFEGLKNWKKACDESAEPPEVFFVVGNKCDLDDSRVVSRAAAQRWADEQGAALYIETSAVSGTAVDDLFNAIGRAAEAAVYTPNAPVVVNIQKEGNQQQKSKCAC